MKLSRPILFLVACTLSLAAAAQWQWVDKTGRKVYSDRPPPFDIPEASIIKQPRGARNVSVSNATAALPGAAPAASAPARAASGLPKLSGKDTELEAKKKQAEQEEAAKKKAADDKLAADQAQNCERAKASLATLNSGRRIQQSNAQGDREIMTDEARAAEVKRTQEVISRDCGGGNPK
ncbi:MAG: DUF4124 domain-containing protein [Burkholderiaceae bacterium]|nr:DUF4124 domain-containing protein [Burkholderiaceae bacterium]